MPQIVEYSNADAGCLQIGSTSNYGGTQNLSLCATSGDLRFSAVNFNLANLPAGAKVSSATLEIIKYSGADTAMTLRAERFTGSWTELGITYSNAPATTYDGDTTTTITSTNQTYVLNVTKICQAWANGASKYGIKLIPTAGSLTYLRSREYSWVSVKLTINYTLVPEFIVNVGDTWKTPTEVYVNVGDTWRTVTNAYVNVGDTWKEI